VHIIVKLGNETLLAVLKPYWVKEYYEYPEFVKDEQCFILIIPNTQEDVQEEFHI
jgi:hypothetical protein